MKYFLLFFFFVFSIYPDRVYQDALNLRKFNKNSIKFERINFLLKWILAVNFPYHKRKYNEV
jgi:hypothetical protein